MSSRKTACFTAIPCIVLLGLAGAATPAEAVEPLRFDVSLTSFAEPPADLSEHLASGVAFTWHTFDRIHLRAAVQWFWLSRQTGTPDTTPGKTDLDFVVIPVVTLRNSAELGVDGVIARGPMSLVGYELEAAFVGSAAVFVADAKTALRPADPTTGRDVTNGDVGVTPGGSLGLAMQVSSGRWFVRLGLRWLAFSAAVTTINGCTRMDVQRVETRSTLEGSACRRDAFVDPAADAAAADDRLRWSPQPGELRQVFGADLGVGMSFSSP